MKSVRLKPGDRMDLVRGELILAGAPLPVSQNVHLCPVADPACRIDGLAQGRRVAMVSDMTPPPWMTGVNWHLHPQTNGSWQVVNQNEMQHCLSAVSGRLELGTAMDGFTATSTNWLIYRQPGRDVFCLRPVGGQWLCWRDGKISLKRRAGPLDETVLWQFHLPDPNFMVSEPSRVSPAKVSATRRILGALSTYWK